MLLAFGAAASAIDSLFGLMSSKQTAPTGSGQDQANLFAFQADAQAPQNTSTSPVSGSGGAKISPETMSALLAAQSQTSTANVSPTSRTDALKELFSQIDADGDGQITKSEFEDALGAGGTNLAQADDVFSKLDKNGDGSVSLDEMSSALKGGHGGHHGHHHMTSGSGDSGDPLLQALQGANSSTVTNADGSTTTSLTYADGSAVTMTTPATSGTSSTSSTSSTATSSYNFIEQLIQRQANMIASQASSSLSVSV